MHRKSGTLRLLALILVLGHSALAQAQIDPAARAALPDKQKQSGVLEVATSLQWPPFDFVGDDNQPDGIDIQLLKGIAGKLGLTAHFTDVKFPTIVPGVANGRFDVGVDEIANTAERRNAVQFVDYYRAGMGLLIRNGAPALAPDQLCGHSVAVTQGSFQVSVAQHLSEACTAAGSKPITQLAYPDSADTYLAVASGRADAFITDHAVGIYIARQNTKLAVMPGNVAGTYNISGVVVGKDNGALATALTLALKSMIQDGSYQAILSSHGVPDAALSPADVDAVPPG
jgi:polar amino acid transport system substrate-binding protein